MARSLLETPWAVALDPARRDGRIVAESSEGERGAKLVSLPAPSPMANDAFPSPLNVGSSEPSLSRRTRQKSLPVPGLMSQNPLMTNLPSLCWMTRFASS